MIKATCIEWIKAEIEGDADRLTVKDKAGDILLELALPNEAITRFIADHAKADISMHLDGTIYADIITEDELTIAKIALDDLVARDTSPDKLEDEPKAMQLLDTFDNRLRKSLAAVAAARTLIKRD